MKLIEHGLTSAQHNMGYTADGCGIKWLRDRWRHVAHNGVV